MDTVAGQTFLNYAYSWGASIVILGALFKLTHMPSADFWLFLGMGTEVLVFFITAFDRPFDKTAEGMELKNSVTGRLQAGNDELPVERIIDPKVREQINETVANISREYLKQLEIARDNTDLAEEISEGMTEQAYHMKKIGETLKGVSRVMRGRDSEPAETVRKEKED